MWLFHLVNVKCPVVSGSDQCDVSDETDGIQTHQLCQSEDDDDAPYRPQIQRGLPSALLPVSNTHTYSTLHTVYIHSNI